MKKKMVCLALLAAALALTLCGCGTIGAVLTAEDSMSSHFERGENSYYGAIQ